MQHWLYLAVAIVSEVLGTSALKGSEGFTRLWPSLVVVIGYASAFFFLSLTLRTIPVGVAYAIWAGAGIVLIALFSWLFLGQTLDIPALIGLVLTVAGVVVTTLFSRTISLCGRPLRRCPAAAVGRGGSTARSTTARHRFATTTAGGESRTGAGAGQAGHPGKKSTWNS